MSDDTQSASYKRIFTHEPLDYAFAVLTHELIHHLGLARSALQMLHKGPELVTEEGQETLFRLTARSHQQMSEAIALAVQYLSPRLRGDDPSALDEQQAEQSP